MRYKTQILYLKFDWSIVCKIVREEMANAVFFESNNFGFEYHYRHMLYDTDTFWPFGVDTDLNRALRYTLVPKVNYRSCLSYNTQKDAISEIKIAIEEMFYTMQDNIVEYYSNPLNFPPDYIQPEQILFDEAVVEHIYKRIRREAVVGTTVVKY